MAAEKSACPFSLFLANLALLAFLHSKNFFLELLITINKIIIIKHMNHN